MYKKGHKAIGNFYKKGHIPWSKGKKFGEYEKIICKKCNKEFEVLKTLERIYCSKECKYKDHSNIGYYKHSEETKRKIGEANKKFYGEHPEKIPTWNGGASFKPYGRWFRPLRESIRKRDNYICQICGKNQNECKYKLSIHHIDYIKSNYNNDNLISLCTSCHARTNVNRDYWKGYFYGKN